MLLRMYLVSIRPENVVLASTKVCVYLSRQEGVLGNVCLSRVFVQRQKEKPDCAYKDAQRRKVRRKLEQARVMAKAQDCGSYENVSLELQEERIVVMVPREGILQAPSRSTCTPWSPHIGNLLE